MSICTGPMFSQANSIWLKSWSGRHVWVWGFDSPKTMPLTYLQNTCSLEHRWLTSFHGGLHIKRSAGLDIINDAMMLAKEHSDDIVVCLGEHLQNIARTCSFMQGGERWRKNWRFFAWLKFYWCFCSSTVRSDLEWYVWQWLKVRTAQSSNKEIESGRWRQEFL